MNVNGFYNNELGFDVERLMDNAYSKLSSLNIEKDELIDIDFTTNKEVIEYTIEVEDSSYSYTNENKRNEDYERLKFMLPNFD